MRDPLIGKVMSMMHARPAHDWTIDELAREAGMSPVLAERFAKLVGSPPMHYLAKWRMQVASELLMNGKANLASIAADIGYESEASFSRAFKK
jgi:transcriptional regulator GlxA family with amidase domain